ncbi:MAG: beta-ketoacyl synthase, partial [Gammaproteobacteria bacterium]|nr:beta-ketoacyl synthase [Gammaproteobacteria bacterium]
DFVNAYILGSVGATGANVGACATFLYNLRQGITDIRAGNCRVAVIGSSEAPITPEVIEGYRTMGALAEDDALLKLDGRSEGRPDHTRACRPFAENCGFTLAEASQFVILFDDELALELGANIYGSVADVFVNADGFKKSIPGPGIGNYLTVGKAMGVVRAILGDKALANNTYMQAHGTGTPQNRVTESHIFNALAKNFGIRQWPVTAIKAFLGHSLACASGDQIIASLGVWHDGIIPGIKTTRAIAEDVHQSQLDFLLDHREINPSDMQAAFINSKGFGGNNATAAILSPFVTETMLTKRYGLAAMRTYKARQETVAAATKAYDAACIKGETQPIYRFGEAVVEGDALTMTPATISIPGQTHPISLTLNNPYEDMV